MAEQSIYSAFADTYATFSEHSGPNAGYDRPAILQLAGEVAGRRVLELGCAGGVLTEHLVDRGADVLALDREPRMVELAQQRMGERARVVVAELEQPLQMVPTSSMDVVVASLVLHYIADWAPMLDELHRCLVPGGVLVFSIHHPFTGWIRSDQADYHRTELITEDWDWDGQPVTGTLYRRPLSAIFGPLLQAGFTIDVVEEPHPQTDIADPTTATILNTQPVFLFIRARRQPD